MKKIDKGYRIFKKVVSSDTSKSLFIAFNETINFVTQKNKKFKSWNDKKLHEFLINLRVKNKEKFSMIYDLMQKNSVLEEFCIKNNLVMRAVRDGMMSSPPLTITKDDIDKCSERFKISLDSTLKDIKEL